MKQICFLLLCLVAWSVAEAQGGVDFRELSFDEALKAAKIENKLVFMDCYTSWCGPCKNMANKVFPQAAAGEFFNPRFVCVKYDMEKGEGKELAEKFGVHAYPTFLIFRPDGTVQHRLVGGDGLEGFIERVKKGLDPATSLVTLDEQYAQGKMDKGQLLAYYSALYDAGDEAKAATVYKELLDKLTDAEKMSKVYWPIYSDESCKVGSPLFRFLLDNCSEIERNVGREPVHDYLFWMYADNIDPYVRGYGGKESLPLAKLKKQVALLNIEGKEKLEKSIALAERVQAKDIEKLAAYILGEMDGLTPRELVTYTHTYFWAKESGKKSSERIADFNRQMAEKTIAHLEARKDKLDVQAVNNYATVFNIYIKDNIGKDIYARMVAAAMPVIDKTVDQEEVKFLKSVLEEFRKKAQ